MNRRDRRKTAKRASPRTRVVASVSEAFRLDAAGRVGEAEAAWRRVVALAPDLADAHHNLGNLL